MKLLNNPQTKFVPDWNVKLMYQVRQVLRYHHYSYRTEQAYCGWIVRFIKYHGSKTSPTKMGKEELCTASCGKLMDQISQPTITGLLGPLN